MGLDAKRGSRQKPFKKEHRCGRAIWLPIPLDDTVIDANEVRTAKLRAHCQKGYDEYHKSFERVLRDLTVKKPQGVPRHFSGPHS